MSNQLYHLIVFLACLGSLLALIITGHDNSPIINSLLTGGVGGSAVGAFGKLTSAIFGGGSQSSQSGYASPFILAIIAGMLIVGCAALKTDKVATSCASASAAIKTLTVARNNGLISVSEQKLINDAVTVVEPICTSKVEPPATTAAVNALNSAVSLLTSAAAAHPNGT